MYKDKTKQKEAVKKAVRKHRQGITPKGITEQGITYPHIIDKLTDPWWREHLGIICSTFREDMKECTYLGGVPLTTVCDWLECTS